MIFSCRVYILWLLKITTQRWVTHEHLNKRVIYNHKQMPNSCISYMIYDSDDSTRAFQKDNYYYLNICTNMQKQQQLPLSLPSEWQNTSDYFMTFLYRTKFALDLRVFVNLNDVGFSAEIRWICCEIKKKINSKYWMLFNGWNGKIP